MESPGERWLVSPYGNVGWVHNVRARPELSLRRARHSKVFRAEEVSAEAAGPVLKQYLTNVRATVPFFDVKSGDPVAEFVAEADRHPVFRLVGVP